MGDRRGRIGGVPGAPHALARIVGCAVVAPGAVVKELNDIGRLTRTSYDLVAAKYDELFSHELDQKPGDRQLLDEFAARFAPDSIIYDMGCGPSGHVGHYLHTKGLHVIGSDISPKCIDLASARHPDMTFLTMDMANLMLGDCSIDGIVSHYSIIHTPRRLVPRIFQEFQRVLKVGGALLLAVKEGDREALLEDFLGWNTKIHFTWFRRDEIAQLMAENGFAIHFLEQRAPLEGEIPVSRIFAIGEKRCPIT